MKNQYDVLLKARGFSPLPEYSGTYSQWSQTISFNTYNHYSTGVVVILSAYEGKTWVCYIIGSVFVE